MTRTVLKEYPCNCVIVAQSKEGIGEHSIEYCPLHQSAPKLCEALKALIFQFSVAIEHPYSKDKEVYEQANKALAEAEGKQAD